MNNESLYIPPNVTSLKDITQQQVRLGIQGYPGVGKTWSALTFPNPIVMNYDNKLGVHIGKDIPTLPFYDSRWFNAFKKGQEHRHDAVLRWIQTEGIKLTKDQTLIQDSWSTLQNWFDIAMRVPYYTKDGKEDGYKFWNLKIDYALKMMEALKMLTCNVVVTFHETVERNDNGNIVGLKPLMQGQFADQLAGCFTDWFRQVVMEKKNDKGEPIKGEYQYLWQVRSDNIAKCLTSKIIPNGLMYVPADYRTYFLNTNTTTK